MDAINQDKWNLGGGIVCFLILAYGFVYYLDEKLWFLLALPIGVIGAILGAVLVAVLLEKCNDKGSKTGCFIFCTLACCLISYGLKYHADDAVRQAELKEQRRMELAAKIIKEQEANESSVSAANTEVKQQKPPCDKQEAQNIIKMITQGGVAERQDTGLVVYYIWQNNWYGMSKEQRYNMISGLGGVEQCLTGKAVRIRVAGEDVAHASIRGEVRLLD